MQQSNNAVHADLADASFGNDISVTGHEPLVERAFPGLHQEVLGHLVRTVNKNDALLDLACGTGAWLSRLRREGFTDLFGVDGSSESYAFDRSIFKCLDFDHPYTEKLDRRFDVITAIEIIEHVENPTGFLRDARKLIKPGGYFFVTTPNVECIQGRLRFLLNGKLRTFEDDGTGDPTHISPLLSSLLPRLTEKAGWKIQERLPLITDSSRPAVRVLCKLLSPFLKGMKEGDCHLFILRPD